VLIHWGVSLAGLAGLVGIVHLLKVHGFKVKARGQGRFSSLLVILSFLVTLAAGIWLTPANPGFQNVIISIQTPVETSLMAVLAITLALAGLRLFQRKKDLMSVIFILSAVVFLLGMVGVFPAGTGSIGGWLQRLPLAGGRGILLGVALGSLITGLRTLLGMDRPYNG